MTVVSNLSRRRAQSQILGIIPRSIGYLQGGYKDSTLQSKVQLFNTITQTGRIVYDTGYLRRYTPGLSGNFSGYFSTSDSATFSKFSYVTSTAASSFSMLQYPSVTASDFNIFTVGWVLCSTAVSTSAVTCDRWTRMSFTTETPVNYGALGNAFSMTRQSASTGLGSVFVQTNYTGLSVLNYATNTVTSNAGNSSLMNSGEAIAVGLSRNDDSSIAFVGMSPFHCKVGLTGTVVNSISQLPAFTYHFSESHTVTSATDGYLMAGYSDTTGRYGGTQHALCQKTNFSNNAITTLPDLVLAQSSGQMMQGF